MSISCFECKFYDGWCCMYNLAVKSILNEEDSASKCSNYSVGKYDEEELEKNEYK